MNDKFDVTSLTSVCEALSSVSNLQKISSNMGAEVGKLNFSKVPGVKGTNVYNCKSCLNGVCGMNETDSNLNEAFENIYDSVNLLYKHEAEASGLFGGRSFADQELDFAKYYLYNSNKDDSSFGDDFASDIRDKIATGTLTEEEAKMLQVSMKVRVNVLAREIDSLYKYIKKHKNDPDISEKYNEILAKKAIQNAESKNYLMCYQFYDDFKEISQNRIARVRVIDKRDLWTTALDGKKHYLYGKDGVVYVFYDANGKVLEGVSNEEIQLFCARQVAAGGVNPADHPPVEWNLPIPRIDETQPLTNETLNWLMNYTDYWNGRKEKDSDFWTHLDASTLQVYNYLAHKSEYSKDKSLFVSVYQDEVNQKIATEQFQEFVSYLDKSGDVGDYILTVLQGISDGTNTFFQGIDTILKGVSDTTSVVTYKQAMILEYLRANTHYLDNAYEFSTSLGNMIPSIAVGVVTSVFLTPACGRLAGSLLMGASAAGNAAQEAYMQGVDKRGAALYGVLSGISETSLQMILGKIPGLSITTKSYLLNVLGEGLEESAQEVIGTLLLNKISGMDTPVDAHQVLKAGIYGIITAGLFNGGELLIGDQHLFINAKDIDCIRESFKNVKDWSNPFATEALLEYTNSIQGLENPNVIDMQYYIEHFFGFGDRVEKIARFGGQKVKVDGNGNPILVKVDENGNPVMKNGKYEQVKNGQPIFDPNGQVVYDTHVRYGFLVRDNGTIDFSQLSGCHTVESFNNEYTSFLKKNGFEVERCYSKNDLMNTYGNTSTSPTTTKPKCYYYIKQVKNGVYEVYYSVPRTNGRGEYIGTKVVKECKTIMDTNVYAERSIFNMSFQAMTNIVENNKYYDVGKYIGSDNKPIYFKIYKDANTGQYKNAFPIDYKEKK